MREAGILIGLDGEVLYEHVPAERTAVSLPDDDALWNAIWENRDRLAGFAHTHPAGGGTSSPSLTDVKTFAAVEAALGKRLTWWIATYWAVVAFVWRGPGRFDYDARIRSAQMNPHSFSTTSTGRILVDPPWLALLRGLSFKEKEIHHDHQQ